MPNGNSSELPLVIKNFQNEGTDSAESSAEIEQTVARIWAKVLGLESVAVTDDFFALGGNSLKATRILAQIFETFGVELSHRSLFESSKVTELAKHIERLHTMSRPTSSVAIQRLDSGLTSSLSWGQMEIWLTVQQVPNVPVYNEPFTVYMPGRINASALEKSLQEMIQRHASLRTGFIMKNGEPVQVVQEMVSLNMVVADLSLLDPTERESRALHFATAQARRIFDLEQPPLMRATFVCMHETDYRLYLVFHHIVMDAFAIYNIFMPELWQLYNGFAGGNPASLPQTPIFYSDYVRWQRERSSEALLDENLTYWRNQLNNLSVLEMPVDRPHPPVRSFRGAHQRFTLSKDLTDNLQMLSNREGVTLFVTLLAAFKALLWRYTQAIEITIGTVEFGRSRREFEQVMGYFLTTLVLRTKMGDDLSFPQLLQRVREVVLAAHTHKDVSFMKLVEELRPKRDRSRNPLFQIAFVMEPSLPEHTFDWTISQLDVQTGTAKFDLTVELEERPEGVIGRFEYNGDVFDDKTIHTMIGRFQLLLENIIANPSQTIATLPLMMEAERRLLQHMPSSEITGTATDACLHELFEAQVERTPNALAVSIDGHHLSYAELNCHANQLSHHLRELGIAPEVPVVICVERSLELVIGILGILKAGGAYVPLDPTHPQERLALLMEEIRATVLVTQQHLIAKIPPHSAKVVCLENGAHQHDLLCHRNPISNVQPDNLAYVIYTSGSTGRPKGVMITHRNVARLFASTESEFHFDSNDIWTLFHSYAFDFSVWEMWGALLYGGRLVIVPHWLSRSMEDFYNLLSQERVTVLNQTPAAFRELLHEGLTGTKQLSLRLIIFGGEALDIRNLKPWFDKYGEMPQLNNMYGITETTVHVTSRLLRVEDTQHSGSFIGKPISDLQLHILDQYMQLVPPGVPGEIYVGGGGLARGYLQDTALTAERFLPNPYSNRMGDRLYKTGDLARYLSDGDIEYLGRADHQVKIRGFRIELGEIEAVLRTHPSVKDAAVIVREDKPDVKVLVAYFAANKTMLPVSSELHDFLKRKLPEYMLPAIFVHLETLPLTSSGKIDRKALPAPVKTQPISEYPLTATQTKATQILTEVWGRVLGVERVNVHDNFFDIGGDSFSALQVMNQLRVALQVELPVSLLFEKQTLVELAMAIDELLFKETGASTQDQSKERES